jgi:homoserine kinase
MALHRKRVVRAHASSANLGAGYDVLAVSLSPVLELEVEETGAFSVEADLPDVPLDRTNLCVQAFERLHPADRFAFRIRSQIPPAAGLGSSAAAIVAGLAAADHMFELDADLFALATEIEGHPDNVAAAVYGGFVVCGPERVARIAPPPELEAVIAIPPQTVPTAAARRAIPAEIPLADCVHNIAATAQLVLGLERGDLSLVAAALADRIHQPRRQHLYPRSLELVAAARTLGALGATISGAGPTVLLWCEWQQTGRVVERARARFPDFDVRRVNFSDHGVDVRAL